MNAKGIDIHHTRPPLWEGKDFVILKASQGTTWKDPKFRDRAMRAKDDGLIVFAYHWFEVEKAHPPKDQASNFLEQVNGLPVSGLFVDFERYNNPRTGTEADDLWAMMQSLETNTNLELGIYSNPGSWNERIDTYWNRFYNRVNRFKKYMLWIAHWTSNNQPDAMSPWDTWDFWQIGIEKIDGEPIDHDIYNGSKTALINRFEIPNDSPDFPSRDYVHGYETAYHEMESFINSKRP